MIIKYNHKNLKKYAKMHKKSGYYGLTTLACLDKDYQTIITSVTTLIILTYSNKISSIFNKKTDFV